jgi:hypothetical protein
MFTVVQHDSYFHIRLYCCRITVPQRVSLVREELLHLPDHPTSSPVSSYVRVSQSLVFCVDYCLTFCPFLDTVVSGLLRITSSDYPFGISELFVDID